MKKILERLAIPNLSDNAIKEINYASIMYSCEQNKFGVMQDRKRVLSDLLEIFIGLFDLNYDLKIRFNEDYDSDGCVYLGNAYKQDFNIALYKLYRECFLKYVDKIYLLNDNRIEAADFTALRLGYLNRDRSVLEFYINSSYNELISEKLRNSNIVDVKKVSFGDINLLMITNKKRNYELKEQVLGYPLNLDLSFSQVRSIYNCFSSDVFDTLSKKEKVVLTNLLSNYFYPYEDKDNLKIYKKGIDEKTTNKDAIALIISCLIDKENTLIIKKHNENLINDILSGTRYIYENEIYKQNLKSMNDVTSLVRVISR